MKTLLLASLLVPLATPAMAWGAQATPTQLQTQSQNMQSQTPAPSDFKSAEGDLSRMDSAKGLLWIKGQDGKEMEFKFTSQTQVTGGDNTVEGLNKMEGTHLKIQYQVVGGSNNAVKIEIAPVEG
jgi:hypothetical protein